MSTDENKKFYAERSFATIALLLIAAAIVTVAVYGVYDPSYQFFTDLAKSFLQGRLDLTGSSLVAGDVAPFNGKVYWPLGPFPALFLAPFVFLFGSSFVLGHAAIILIVLIGWLVYKLARTIGFRSSDSLWLVFAFLFASPFLTVAWVPRSWGFAHVVAVVLLFWILYEYFHARRYVLIGVLFACILATRVPAAFTLAFLIADIVWSNRTAVRKLVLRLAQVLAPVGIAGVLLLIYNYLRFENIFEVGYSIANLGPDLVQMRSYGVLSLAHIPANVYYLLFAGPLPVTESVGTVLKPPYLVSNLWGVGLLFSAPYLFGLIWKRLPDRLNTVLWIGALASLAPLLLYFGIGPYQLSYRYALDFLPLVFIIFMRSIYYKDKKLDTSFKVLIAASFFLGLHLFLFSVL